MNKIMYNQSMFRIFSAYWENPKDAHFAGSDPDEKVLLVLRKHFITNFPWIFLSVLLSVFPFVIVYRLNLSGQDFQFLTLPPRFYPILALFWYFFIFLFSFENFLSWFFSVYIVSTKKIVDYDFHGIIYRNIAEAPLRNIEDIHHTIKGFWPLIFNYGDITIQTAGEKREFDFIAVPNPLKIQDLISDYVANLQNIYAVENKNA